MALPALPITAETRAITDRTNVLIRTYNAEHAAVPVASLPANPAVGDRWLVSDALAPAFLAPVAGSGAVVCPVTWDGTNWVVA